MVKSLLNSPEVSALNLRYQKEINTSTSFLRITERIC